MRIKITEKTEVCNYGKPYIIAELGANHNGDMELAKKLIIAAKESGADCVKFQSWTKESVSSRKVYEDNYFLNDDYRNRSDFSLEKIVEKFSISEEELLKMKQFSDRVGIDCTSTPFSKKEVDFLVDALNAPFIKIASMDLNNYPFLSYIAKKGKPIVLSTGLSELYEIDKAIRTIEKAGNEQIIILHCVANYPPKDEEINLNRIATLQKLYPFPVGFSDHTLGVSIPLAAIAVGACIVEKHFTLDKSMFGWDHKVSATPDELKMICSEALRINIALGKPYIRCEESDERKAAFRRSIVATRNISPGEVITESDVDYKRPGLGIAPEDVGFIIGRIAKKTIEFDRAISKEDLV
ncbi:MAG: N-acetylneuraminate synthase family protein [Gammaproteobacteria bacterium]|nr:N-acetylneuraminate synthase family protein [Gammaproteobacteria bacterium]